VVGSMFYETCEKCNGLGQLKCPNCTNGQVWVSTEPLA
jgi:DnaJ-class molecular chaperone